MIVCSIVCGSVNAKPQPLEPQLEPPIETVTKFLHLYPDSYLINRADLTDLTLGSECCLNLKANQEHNLTWLDLAMTGTAGIVLGAAIGIVLESH